VSIVDDVFLVSCPYCGESLELYVEPDVGGTFVQDCEVCCQPMLVQVIDDGDGREVVVESQE
jgi:hypothetical protein